jgi:NhaA family Na+:H+ antiporter
VNSNTKQTLGGGLLLGGALLALFWANSPAHASYEWLHQFAIIPAAAIFIFFVTVGLELRHEITDGSLSNLRKAVLPISAAIGGMIVPALAFVAFNFQSGSLAGWAIPMSTDIAFALAVLAIFGKRLPPEMRVFLLTVAVVDDVLAIAVIAIFYTTSFSLLSLASVFGVVIGLLLPRGIFKKAGTTLADFNSMIGLPLFVFFEAGVYISPTDSSSVLNSTVIYGIAFGLIVGKPLGVLAGTYIASSITKQKIDWQNLFPIALLCGVGFTVALLMNSLSFAKGSLESASGTMGVLVGSAASASLAVYMMNKRTNVA